MLLQQECLQPIESVENLAQLVLRLLLQEAG